MDDWYMNNDGEWAMECERSTYTPGYRDQSYSDYMEIIEDDNSDYYDDEPPPPKEESGEITLESLGMTWRDFF